MRRLNYFARRNARYLNSGGVCPISVYHHWDGGFEKSFDHDDENCLLGSIFFPTVTMTLISQMSWTSIASVNSGVRPQSARLEGVQETVHAIYGTALCL